MHELTLHALHASIVTCDQLSPVTRGGALSLYSSASAKTLDKFFLRKYRQSMFAGSLSQHICWSLLDAPILSIVNPTRTPATLDLGKASDYFPKALILTIVSSCASFLLFCDGLGRPVIHSYLPGNRFLFKS